MAGSPSIPLTARSPTPSSSRWDGAGITTMSRRCAAWCAARPRRSWPWPSVSCPSRTRRTCSRLCGSLRNALRQDAVALDLGRKTGLLQPAFHFLLHIAAAGELVGRPGVVEQAAVAHDHACQLIVESLRIQLACGAEARRVMQDGVEALRRQFGDDLRDIAQSQLQARIRARRPGIHGAQPQDRLALLEGAHLGRLVDQAPVREVAEASTAIQDAFAA